MTVVQVEQGLALLSHIELALWGHCGILLAGVVFLTFRRGSPMVRFFRFVRYDGDCWLWRGASNGKGYGKYWHAGRMVYAHRFSYEQHHGEIPVGLVLDHTCRNRACVNPMHLEPVSVRENTIRGHEARRSAG